jgi:aryl-alcohol dehydrogenase-like predicted oxidoreductase
VSEPEAAAAHPIVIMMLGSSGLEVSTLCLGGNVFGWTADESRSFAVLDAYAAAGGNFIDTSDLYSEWVPGHVGGESEAILGRWMEARNNRASMVIASKVGKLSTLAGLSPHTIRSAIVGSLGRLRTDYVDLYYAHIDDAKTPLVDTLAAFDGLVREGKVRALGASNYAAPRLAQALAISKRESLARYAVLQPNYNLVHRGEYEGALEALCVKEGVAVAPYYALASGFLTGKYRAGAKADTARGGSSDAYGERGARVIGALAEIAGAHETTIAAAALAWLKGRPGVATPIASARTVEQLGEILPMTTLALDAGDVARLDAASA